MEMETVMILLQATVCLCMAVLGSSMASGLMCVGERLADRSPLIRKRSSCPCCGMELRALDIIPVLSWLFLKGHCRYCGAKIPVRHFVTELLMAVLYVAAYIRYGASVMCFQCLFIMGVLFCASVQDFISRRADDILWISAALFWLISEPFAAEHWYYTVIKAAASAFIIFLLLIITVSAEKVTGRKVMGGADIKIMLPVLMYVPEDRYVMLFILLMLITVLYGLAVRYGVIRIRHEHEYKENDKTIPLVPAIAAAAAAVLQIF